ncbi:hypothetical protein E5K00_14595 [Hymenobacter aquaticus]|uniref:Uncharacterized protein n=1 Tax=Hymenobacter aquaticus TaxID=1867101 RepID=A0A4Z0PYH2_9BACT|nr:hypothetical protein [Hymenobacter aquaticus]TGE21512.1 hypothetical protein E5K00_14595 [Hymenobacter aquaticus]
MLLYFTADKEYPRRPLPPTPYLQEEPRAATAALETAVRACPKPDYFGNYPFPTPGQRHELCQCLDSPYLTHREAVWLELWRTQFDTDTAARVLGQLHIIIRHRQATGIMPVPHKGGYFFPEQVNCPRP